MIMRYSMGTRLNEARVPCSVASEALNDKVAKHENCGIRQERQKV